MDIMARNQYIKTLQDKYFTVKSKKQKSEILDEYVKNTTHNRKYAIRKINSDIAVLPKKRTRSQVYDVDTVYALARVWEIFDYPCGQRLAPVLGAQLDRLRALGELNIRDDVAKKLKRISPSTIDIKLRHQKQILHLKSKYHKSNNPLIYKKIPTRCGDWDKYLIGQIEIDSVEHCGSSNSGNYVHSISCVDIASGWWEAQAVMGKGQLRTFYALSEIRKRTPFNWREIHPDNESVFINWHIFNYTEKENIIFSRSRPYRKNDNCFVEQKNSTHIRAVFGYRRYDTDKELELINSLYRKKLRLYKNFFLPVMKLKEKLRVKGKVFRKYDNPLTPLERLLRSGSVSSAEKNRLKNIYLGLNPAELKRQIDEKLRLIFKTYEQKRRRPLPSPSNKRLSPTMCTKSYILNDLKYAVSVT